MSIFTNCSLSVTYWNTSDLNAGLSLIFSVVFLTVVTLSVDIWDSTLSYFLFLWLYFFWLCYPGTGCSRGQTQRWRTGLGIAVARRSERLQTRRHHLTTWPRTEQSAQLLTACLNAPVADRHSGTNMTYWQVVWTLHRFTLKNSDSSRGDTSVTRNIDERAYLSSFKPIVEY